MSVVVDLERIAEWARETICSQISLKVPDDDHMDMDYEYETVNPNVYTLFVPNEDDLRQPAKSIAPYLAVQVVGVEDDAKLSQRVYSIRFLLAAWNPGMHGAGDVLAYRKHSGAEDDYRVYYEQTPSETFQATDEGWRDAWNFLDLTLWALESFALPDGLTLVRDEEIRSFPYQVDGDLVDCYPYFYNYVEFKVRTTLIRDMKAYQGFL